MAQNGDTAAGTRKRPFSFIAPSPDAEAPLDDFHRENPELRRSRGAETRARLRAHTVSYQVTTEDVAAGEQEDRSALQDQSSRRSGMEWTRIADQEPNTKRRRHTYSVYPGVRPEPLNVAKRPKPRGWPVSAGLRRRASALLRRFSLIAEPEDDPIPQLLEDVTAAYTGLGQLQNYLNQEVESGSLETLQSNLDAVVLQHRAVACSTSTKVLARPAPVRAIQSDHEALDAGPQVHPGLAIRGGLTRTLTRHKRTDSANPSAAEVAVSPKDKASQELAKDDHSLCYDVAYARAVYERLSKGE